MDSKWALSRISGGLAGVNFDYSLGEVYWTFNTENNTLTVENNIVTNGPKSAFAGQISGDYSYNLSLSDSVLTIGNTERGKVNISGSSLTIDDDVATDGLFTEFILISD